MTDKNFLNIEGVKEKDKYDNSYHPCFHWRQTLIQSYYTVIPEVQVDTAFPGMLLFLIHEIQGEQKKKKNVNLQPRKHITDQIRKL